MKFQLLRPQQVRCETGAIVQFGGRYDLQYLHPDGRVLTVEVADDMPLTVYRSRMTVLVPHVALEVSTAEREAILTEILGALRVMGVPYVVRD